MEFLDQFGSQISQLFLHLSHLIEFVGGQTIAVTVGTLAQVTAALIGAYGLWKAWRFAEIRIGQRLIEYLDREEERLNAVRSELYQALRNQDLPVIGKHKIYSNTEMNAALKKFKWARNGNNGAREKLKRTSEVTKIKESVAKKKVMIHEQQRALTNLLQGAICDATGDHEQALGHFKAALDVDENDAVALEYAGIQLIKRGEPQLAIEHFKKLEVVARTQKNMLLVAHAYRNIGNAWEAESLEKFGNANNAYISAIKAFPSDGPTFDLGSIHEMRGRANLKLGNYTQAKESFVDAIAKYSPTIENGGKNSKEAAEGRQRVNKLLAELRNNQVDAPTPNQPPPAPVPFPASS